MFDIELLGQPEGKGDGLYNWGRLTLGHFREEFQAPLVDWAPGDYAAHWLQSAQGLLKGAPVVVFLTHMVRADAPYHLGWPAWRDGERVHVQERLFLRDQLNGVFDPEFPEVHVGPRREVSVEGIPISQWELGLSDFAAFVKRRQGSTAPA